MNHKLDAPFEIPNLFAVQDMLKLYMAIAYYGNCSKELLRMDDDLSRPPRREVIGMADNKPIEDDYCRIP